MTILNMPRAVNVPFSGAFFHNHPDLAQHVGKVLTLHRGLNNVDDKIVAGHPALQRFIVDDLKAMEPVMPIGGPGPQAVAPGTPAAQHVGTERQRVEEPTMAPLNEVAAAVAKANQEPATDDGKGKK